MFNNLTKKLNSAFHVLKGHGKITEINIAETLKEVRRALLDADVSFKIAKEFTQRVKEKSLGKNVLTDLRPGQLMVKIVKDELTKLMGGEHEGINLSDTPSIILLSGLQGSGKTTTAVKIAGFLKREFNKKTLLVGLDLQRPAAVEQLEILSNDNNLDCYVEKKSKSPLKVLENAQKYAKNNNFDTLILDTAGRLHVDNTCV
jgi:signal recognition particle subunit SRP54